MQCVSTPLKILIVDDDDVTRALLYDHFTAGGDVVAVESASRAMEIIEREPVQIIVADWLMPDISGLDLLQWMRQRDVSCQPHFVMLTANTGQERLVEAFNAGVDDFLSKPFNETELMARLKAWTRIVTLQSEAQRLTEELRAANNRLQTLASCDELTGLANRRSAMQQLLSCSSLSARHGHPLSCALIDVDHFKRFNDRHGHATGDQVLRHFADVLRSSTREGDMPCRIGGDEFLVILPHTSLGAASIWAEHLTTQLANSPLIYKELILPVQVSIGLAQWASPMIPDELLEAADQMLYTAKNAGRRAVRTAG